MAALEGKNRSWRLLRDAHCCIRRLYHPAFGMLSYQFYFVQIFAPSSWTLIRKGIGSGTVLYIMIQFLVHI